MPLYPPSSSSTLITSFVAYTPTFVGFGTTSSVNILWRRVGDSVQIYGYFTSGIATAATATLSLPAGLTSDSTKLGTGVNMIVGEVHASAAAASRLTSIIQGGQTVLSFGLGNAGSADDSSAQLANSLFTSGNVIKINALIPIDIWA